MENIYYAFTIIQYILGFIIHAVTAAFCLLGYMYHRKRRKDIYISYVLLLFAVAQIILSGMPIALSEGATIIKRLLEIALLGTSVVIIYYLNLYVRNIKK